MGGGQELRHVSNLKACVMVAGNWSFWRCRIYSSGGVALRTVHAGRVRPPPLQTLPKP